MPSPPGLTVASNHQADTPVCASPRPRDSPADPRAIPRRLLWAELISPVTDGETEAREMVAWEAGGGARIVTRPPPPSPTFRHRPFQVQGNSRGAGGAGPHHGADSFRPVQVQLLQDPRGPRPLPPRPAGAAAAPPSAPARPGSAPRGPRSPPRRLQHAGQQPPGEQEGLEDRLPAGKAPPPLRYRPAPPPSRGPAPSPPQPAQPESA